MGIINKILAGGNIRQIIEEETQLKEYKAVYLCHSERSDRRSDEKDVEIHTDKILEPGDDFEMDGLTWYVDKILKDPDRGIMNEVYHRDTLDGLKYKDPLSSKYAGFIVVYNSEKSTGKDPWLIRPFVFDGEVVIDGVTPDICASFIYFSRIAMEHKRGIEALYLIPNNAFEKLLSIINTESREDAIQWIAANCEKVTRKYSDLDDAQKIFDRLDFKSNRQVYDAYIDKDGEVSVVQPGIYPNGYHGKIAGDSYAEKDYFLVGGGNNNVYRISKKDYAQNREIYDAFMKKNDLHKIRK